MSQYYQSLEKVNRWYDKYEGERCFIIGNGPSLRKTPLDLMKDEYCFAMNRIDLVYEWTDWRPAFYSLVTTSVSDKLWAESSKEVIASGIPSFVDVSIMYHYIQWPPPDNVVVLSSTKPSEDTWTIPQIDWWQYDISKGVCKHGTSALAAMQIAMYMGFNPIYLVGCDLGYKPFDYEKDIDPNHYSTKYWAKHRTKKGGTVVTPALAQRMNIQAISAHFLAFMASEMAKVKIYNATIGGELNIYPRVNIHDIL
jgi:hypothetical protein